MTDTIPGIRREQAVVLAAQRASDNVFVAVAVNDDGELVVNQEGAAPAVTALPQSGANQLGAPVYVIDGLIEVKEPVDVNSRDLVNTDPLADASGMPSRLIANGGFYDALNTLSRAVGPNPLANAVTIRFATDALPAPNPTGAPTPAASGVINDGPALLFTLGAVFTGNGAGHYLQLHDAAAVATLADSTMNGWTYPLDQLNQRWQLNFGALAPLKFSAGCRWAISDSEHTYTASAQTAVLRWIAMAVAA